MPSPFPGMDPYLEDTEVWPGFHHRLADEIAGQLTPLIGPKYYADVSLRTVAEIVSIGTTHVTYPDTGVFEGERSLAPEQKPTAGAVTIPRAPIQRVAPVPGLTRLRAVHVYRTGIDRLVTTIEILSPFNKQRREGLEEYREKRARLLNSSTHLVEIDFLRGGERPGPEVLDPPLDTDYVLLVNRFREDAPRISDIWPVAIDESLPLVPVPLLAPDRDVALDLCQSIGAVYARAGYDWRVDYRRPAPSPELRPDMAAWVAELVGKPE